MTQEQLLQAVNAAGVTPAELTEILAGGKITVQVARLKAQAARRREEADAKRQSEHAEAADLEAQAAALSAGLGG